MERGVGGEGIAVGRWPGQLVGRAEGKVLLQVGAHRAAKRGVRLFGRCIPVAGLGRFGFASSAVVDGQVKQVAQVGRIGLVGGRGAADGGVQVSAPGVGFVEPPVSDAPLVANPLAPARWLGPKSASVACGRWSVYTRLPNNAARDVFAADYSVLAQLGIA